MKTIQTHTIHTIIGLLLSGIGSIVTSLIVTINPVLALPNQNIHDVLKWANANPKLSKLSRGTEYYNTNTYAHYDHHFAYIIQFDEKNNLVTEESLSISHEPGINFVQKTNKALSLLAQIYSPSISKDFGQSKYLDTVENMDFYQGTAFGYIVNQYQGTAVIRIISLDHVQAEIEHQKYCAKNPSNCDI